MRTLLQKLDGLGLYKYADPALVHILKERFLYENGYLFEEQTARVYPFDYEYLAEGGVQRYLEGLLPFLRSQGVTIGNMEETIDANGRNYLITIDGKDHVIYMESEFDRAESWGLTVIRTSILVNDLLTSAGSEELFHIVTSKQESRIMNVRLGDTAGVFLSLDLFRAISESGIARDTAKRELIAFLDKPLLQELLHAS